jgi:ribosome maturation factor RimP
MIEDNIEEKIKMAVEGLGVELYDIVQLKENDQNIFRVYITSKDGITLDICSKVSKNLSPLLDVYEPIKGRYNLEVSSPGIERKLKKLKHFIASVGDKVNIKDYNKDTIKGVILKVEGDSIYLQTKHGEESIAFDEISSAKTYYEWE